MSDTIPILEAVPALVGIYLVADKGERLRGVAEIEAVAGQGLAGDRYFLKRGAFSAKEAPTAS